MDEFCKGEWAPHSNFELRFEIIEAAGVSEHADRIEMELSNKSKKNDGKNAGKLVMDSGEYERKVRAPDGMPLYFTMENVTSVDFPFYLFKLKNAGNHLAIQMPKNVRKFSRN